MECIVCKNRTKFKQLFTFTYRGGKSRVYICKKCGLGFVEPFPPQEIALQSYESKDYGFNGKFIWDDNLDIEKISPKIWKEYENVLVSIERIKRPPASLLDIGFSNGLLLAKAREHGWKVVGTEIARDKVEFVTKKFGIEVYLGDITSLFLGRERFDVVVARHVIEHIKQPLNFLSEIHRILSREGILLLETPNFSSPDIQFKNWQSKCFPGKKKPFRHLYLEGHLFFFSPNNLKRLMPNAGFEPLSIESYSAARKHSALAHKVLIPWHRFCLGSKIRLIAKKIPGKG